MRHNATPDSKEYADRLRDALKDAGMICTNDFTGQVFSSEGIPPGVSFTIGNNEKDAIAALANIMVALNLIPKEVTVGINQVRPDAFDITVAPNQ